MPSGDQVVLEYRDEVLTDRSDYVEMVDAKIFDIDAERCMVTDLCEVAMLDFHVDAVDRDAMVVVVHGIDY